MVWQKKRVNLKSRCGTFCHISRSSSEDGECCCHRDLPRRQIIKNVFCFIVNSLCFSFTVQNDGQYVQSLTLKSAEGEFLCALHFHLSVRPVPEWDFVLYRNQSWSKIQFTQEWCGNVTPPGTEIRLLSGVDILCPAAKLLKSYLHIHRLWIFPMREKK